MPTWDSGDAKFLMAVARQTYPDDLGKQEALVDRIRHFFRAVTAGDYVSLEQPVRDMEQALERDYPEYWAEINQPGKWPWHRPAQ